MLNARCAVAEISGGFSALMYAIACDTNNDRQFEVPFDKTKVYNKNFGGKDLNDSFGVSAHFGYVPASGGNPPKIYLTLMEL